MATDSSISILCVDDQPGLADLTATYLERHDDQVTTTTATSAREGLDYLQEADIDCIISDFDMPGLDGLEFLEIVRVEHPTLPFILFTGKGSEEIASDAISAGVTDYMQKESGTDQYQVLAQRVRNAVERQQARVRQAEAERRAETVLEGSPDGILVAVDGEYVYANSAAVELFDAESEGELLGKSPLDLLAPAEHETAQGLIGSIQKGEESITQNRRTAQTLTGETFPIEVTARQIIWDGEPAIVSISRDVTTLRGHERKLREATRQLQGVLDAVEVAVWMRDPEGRYLLANQEARDIVGIDETTEIVGKTYDELFCEEVAAQFRENDQRAIEAREPIEVEEDVPTQNGERAFLTRITPLFDDAGDAYATCGVATDVTELKRREEQLQRERERLDEFTSVVSHDLRNPLNIVEGRLELAREECESDHLTAATAALNRAQSLINDLLTLSREGEQIRDVETVDLAELAEATWENVKTAEATLVIETGYRIRADESRLQQLLENLFRNAVEHGGADVTVTIGDLDDGFYVADDGAGIPESIRDQLFERGVSSDSEGTGFGLTIVKTVADAHGWDVGVTDSERSGARFEIQGVTTTTVDE